MTEPARTLELVTHPVEPSVSQSAIWSVLADYQRQRDQWIAKRAEASRQVDALDGAIQACEALLNGLAQEARDA